MRPTRTPSTTPLADPVHAEQRAAEELRTAYRAVELGAILARTGTEGGPDALQRALRLLERATVHARRVRSAAAPVPARSAA